jgi:hypothetical protein
VEIREVRCRDRVFPFARSDSEVLEGRLLLDDTARAMLDHLMKSESDDWYLDAEGNRLPAAELFERSPWSCPGPDGPVKLLCRFLDLRDGRVLFSTRESYSEGLYNWLQRPSDGMGPTSADED